MRISLTPHTTAAIRSFTVYLKRPIDYDAFEYWLFPLLWERRIGDYNLPSDDLLLRIKGVVALSRDTKTGPYALQVVQDKYDLELLTNWTLGDSAVIFIGRIEEATENILKASILRLCK
ncbi:COBW domain-containing protein 6 [Paramicrosporidium saccamoebae]|uniref:COBW domain-containing protein 6 n=1 Tax=Paramicrosporidium saccamoebae TaxID=1246581 RepID=A0A2H9TMG3_9FUNG|nr:COBW domain-containing protein 6 [Paramicrosporidium saccamoebae]